MKTLLALLILLCIAGCGFNEKDPFEGLTSNLRPDNAQFEFTLSKNLTYELVDTNYVWEHVRQGLKMKRVRTSPFKLKKGKYKILYLSSEYKPGKSFRIRDKKKKIDSFLMRAIYSYIDANKINAEFIYFRLDMPDKEIDTSRYLNRFPAPCGVFNRSCGGKYVNVKGRDIHDVYRWLSSSTIGDFGPPTIVNRVELFRVPMIFVLDEDNKIIYHESAMRNSAVANQTIHAAQGNKKWKPSFKHERSQLSVKNVFYNIATIFDLNFKETIQVWFDSQRHPTKRILSLGYELQYSKCQDMEFKCIPDQIHDSFLLRPTPFSIHKKNVGKFN